MNNGELTKRTQEEETENGRVKWSVYSTFVTFAHKGALVPVIILYHVLFQAIKHWYLWVIAACIPRRQAYLKFKKIKIKILLFHFFFWIFQKNK